VELPAPRVNVEGFRAQHSIRDRGMVLHAHPERTLPRFLDIWKPTATVLVAPRGVRPDATPLGPVEVVPEFRLYDPSGTLQERFPGFLPAGRVEAMVRR
jgi:hypothetical protein